MNLTARDLADSRKTSVFSITSDASFDCPTITSAQNQEISNVIKKLSAKRQQSSRIELREESRVEINREVICLTDFEDKYEDKEDDEDNKSAKQISIEFVKKYFRKFSFFATICSIFPIINWIRNYSFRLNIFYDLIAGLTLSMIQIPEAMANGQLSGLGAAYGLYVAFIPGLIYALMGTSHHTSIGTFSIMSVMVRDVVLRVREETYVFKDSGHHVLVGEQFTSLQILTSLCLLCGLIQALMACFRLGALSVLLPDSIATAFTSAASIQVVTIYFPTLFDINIPRMRYSPFRLFKEWIGFFTNIRDTNFITFGISITSLTILIIIKQLIEPLLKNRFKFRIPLPSDLTIVIVVTVISWLLCLNEKHSVDVIGNIPNGFPLPMVPRPELFSFLLLDSIVISIVSYAVSLSMAKTFAKKHKYEINANQELLAMGTANIFGSFFNCYTSASSLTRSSVLDQVEAKSQFANIIAIIVLLFVILFLESFLYHLPKCILSTIILVALKTMFLQIKDVKRVFKYSKIEGISWIITFVSVIVFDVDLGLLIAIAFSLFVILIRLSKPYNTVLGRLPNTELYVNTKHCEKAIELKGIKIFHFSCALFFVNRQTFKENLYKKVFNISSNDININSNDNIRVKSQISAVIIDCSSMFYMDSSGLETLLEIRSELSKFKIKVLLASCQPTVREMLKNSNSLIDTNSMYVSVHDAVITCLSPNDVSVI